MFSKIKSLFNSANPMSANESDELIDIIEKEILDLESHLTQHPADNATQKALMIKYNQAIKLFSASRQHRDKVDDIFMRVDELRNIIRKNI